VTKKKVVSSCQLDDRKFGHPICWVVPKRISITFQKKISHSMDRGLISTINLIIENLKILPQKSLVTI
jgi:hypothetical protein